MPSKSKKQARLMAAVAHDPKFARKVGIPQSVGREFNEADKRKKKFAGGGLVYATGGPMPRTMNDPRFRGPGIAGRPQTMPASRQLPGPTINFPGARIPKDRGVIGPTQAPPQRLLGRPSEPLGRKPVVPRAGQPGGALAHFRAAQRLGLGRKRPQLPPGGRLGLRRQIPPGKDPRRPPIAPPPGKQPTPGGGYAIPPAALGDQLRRIRLGMGRRLGFKEGGAVAPIRELRRKLLAGELSAAHVRRELLSQGYSKGRIEKILSEVKAGD